MVPIAKVKCSTLGGGDPRRRPRVRQKSLYMELEGGQLTFCVSVCVCYIVSRLFHMRHTIDQRSVDGKTASPLSRLAIYTPVND